MDKSGNFTGFDMDLITEVAKRMGVQAKIQDMGFDSLVAAVQQVQVLVGPGDHGLDVVGHVAKSFFVGVGDLFSLLLHGNLQLKLDVQAG